MKRKKMMYIILYRDGSMKPTAAKPVPKKHMVESRFFEVMKDVPIEFLSNFYGGNFSHPHFREVTHEL